MKKLLHQSLLKNFFGGYFHQDWLFEAENPNAVIAEYLRTATPEDARLLGQAIREYSSEFASDKELEEDLFNSLGCYYCPSLVGISAKEWLEGVAKAVGNHGVKRD